MIIDIVTLFPNMFEGFLNESIIKRAINDDKVSINIINLRNYSTNKHNQVDDTPYGGGSGMVLMVEPVYNCLNNLKKDDTITIMLTPQGKIYNQEKASSYSKYNHIILLCGHYEGFDDRIRDYVDIEISLGDFVLTGGETAAMVITDSIIRLLDDVITKESHLNDSHSNWMLEHPHYTKPRVFDNKEVPSVLISGNHKLIEEFRIKESLKRTYLRRKDLLEKRKLSEFEENCLKEIKKDASKGNK